MKDVTGFRHKLVSELRQCFWLLVVDCLCFDGNRERQASYADSNSSSEAALDHSWTN